MNKLASFLEDQNSKDEVSSNGKASFIFLNERVSGFLRRLSSVRIHARLATPSLLMVLLRSVFRERECETEI